MSVHYQNRGDGDCSQQSNGDEMHEFISFQRQLSRPTDHYNRQRVSSESINPYSPPPKPSQSTHTYISKFLRDPITTSLNSFSRVTNFVTSPTFYDDDYISSLQLLRPPGTAERVPKQDDNGSNHESIDTNQLDVPLPPPQLPPIPCSKDQYRLPRLTPHEFETDFIDLTVDQVLERIFRGV